MGHWYIWFVSLQLLHILHCSSGCDQYFERISSFIIVTVVQPAYIGVLVL
jgi:hypothetical protein